MNQNKKKCGFAVMDSNKVRLYGSLGGKAAHALGVARQWTAEEAREAARKSAMLRSKRLSSPENDPPQIQNSEPASKPETSAEPPAAE